ncbi:hypothetical protein A2973_02545 [Candidatus Gottesmanbacteria bacterium RIFCSPLOWO2_01_FULL_49_10]|uniref:AMP-dependent synthetase/ligase domain-containing protein n=1 Tax=Candidatus Gottesmanbacteria bacterium RIFCSPLOWO2_01_FULL_49_10 TaxID=1798396 RepID=A0A1F6B0V1_9BACT|nr:MAG: hypothetical protein A2973_02545 [Candidatus Gottesmanbacteria bacterium RIFCSPLOWO2_01_FULL_49_10]
MKKDLRENLRAYNPLEEQLAKHARERGEKDAIIAIDPDTDTSIAISYRQLNDVVGAIATYLVTLGMKKGDRFAILMHNAPEVLLFELAGALLGIATVPLDFNRDTLDRKVFKLKDTGARALFIKSEKNETLDASSIQKEIPSLHIVTWSSLDELLKSLPPLSTLPTQGSMSSHYVILYTSGTTALPKGVLLSTRACLANAMGIIKWQQFTDNDRFNIVLPLHHINSTEFCLSMILVGGTIILNSRYSASKFWHIVRRFRATNTSIVPTILHDLLTRSDEFRQSKLDISSLKRICIGSAPVLPEETIRFYDTFGVRLTQGYGQTETALRVAGVPVDVDESTYRELVKNNTIGTKLTNNELAIMDEGNNKKGEGEEGEICIAGQILADGYLNNPAETARSFKNGWFHSGDLGYWKYINDSRNQSSPDSGNRQKYYFIIGRIKEIIIKGGVNLSPSAIEDALLKAFPEIDEVSVVGYPDERMGEEIAAVVVLGHSRNQSSSDSGNDVIVNRILDAAQNGTIPGLSRYEVPKKVFVFDSLPKTSTGKIQRVEVKKAVAELIKKEHPKHYYVREIDDHETEIIKRALGINNARFTFVPSTLEEFNVRAQNGLFFGVFEEHKGLIGSLSCVQVSHAEKIKSWNEASANGTLSNHNPKGGTLLCISISVQSTKTQKHTGEVPQDLAKIHIKEYVNSTKDHVLEFHRKPKGGIPGATVWKILENGRPEDKEAMGYNVLMKYPTIDENTKIVRSNAPSPAILLIEHALLYAKNHGIEAVIAFSRPSGFRRFLVEQSGI